MKTRDGKVPSLVVGLALVAASVLAQDRLTFGGHEFFRPDNPATWPEAENECRVRGAHLASIHSADENSIAKRVCFARCAAEGCNYLDDCWIGLHDRDHEGQMTWSDGSRFDFRPDHLEWNQASRDCFVLEGHYHNGSWEGDHCTESADNPKKHYVCRRKAVGLSVSNFEHVRLEVRTDEAYGHPLKPGSMTSFEVLEDDQYLSVSLLGRQGGGLEDSIGFSVYPPSHSRNPRSTGEVVAAPGFTGTWRDGRLVALHVAEPEAGIWRFTVNNPRQDSRWAWVAIGGDYDAMDDVELLDLPQSERTFLTTELGVTFEPGIRKRSAGASACHVVNWLWRALTQHRTGLLECAARLPPTDEAGQKVIESYNPRQQAQSNWCWAAVSSAVIDVLTGESIDQCELVNQTLGRSDCCLPRAAKGSFCNRPHAVGDDPSQPWWQKFIPGLRDQGPLDNYGVKAREIDDPISFGALMAEIDGGRPVIVWWNNHREKTGHVVVVYGYEIDEDLNQWVIYSDPRNDTDRKKKAFDEFRDNPGDGFEWDGTILTKWPN